MPGVLPPLVILPGALATIEGSGSLAQILGGTRELLTVEYSADDTLDRLVDHIAAIGDATIRSQVDLLGQSYGGWIAQCFAHRYPDRVRRLLLSHSFVLRPADAWRFRLGEHLLRFMPAPVLQKLVVRRLKSAIEPLGRNDPRRRDRLMQQVTAGLDIRKYRSILMAQQRVMRESCNALGRGGPHVSPGLPTLIIESDDDPIIRPEARAKLKARWPFADVERFSRTGHVSALCAPQRYAEVVKRFLQ